MASKSVGQIAGTVIGAAVGFFAGGNVALGASIGGMIGGMIDPPKGPTIVGPRLDDLSFQTSTLGAPLGRAYGTVPVLGNVVWLEGDRYREVITSEEQGGKGGGGGATTETAHYYATFAVSLLRAPDATKTVALRRLWIGSNLVYDAGSDDLQSIIASNTQSSLFSFYSGSDDQQPNTRWQADKGANAVSGFPGRCYIVIYDLDLEPYSRSLAMAQVKAELVVGVATVESDHVQALPADLAGKTTYFGPVQFSNTHMTYSRLEKDSTGSGLLAAKYTTIEVGIGESAESNVDLAVSLPITYYTPAYVAQADRDAILIVSGIGYPSNTGVQLWLFDGAISNGPVISNALIPYENFVCAIDGNDIFMAVYNATAVKIVKVVGLDYSTATSANYRIMSLGLSDTYLFAVLEPSPIDTSATTTVYKFLRSDLSLVATYTETLQSPATLSVVDDNTFYTAHPDSHVHKWVNGAVVADLGPCFPHGFGLPISKLRWYSIMQESPVYCYGVVAQQTNYADFYIGHEVVAQSVASLRDVVTSECALAGVSAAEIDLTAMTDSDVRGYRIANAGSIRSSLEMLQAAYPFDVAPSGYKLRFVSRGGASLATIPEADLGAVSGGDSLPVLLPMAREMDTQIPYSVSVRYLDPAREYDIGEQYASRPDTASVSERTVELTLVLTGDEAAKAADVLNQKDWLERVSFGPFSLPPTWNNIEPTDVVTVEHRGQAHTIRLTRAEFLPDGRIECAGVYSAAQSYTSSATAQDALTVGQSLVPLKGSTQGYLLDMPRIRSEQDVPGMSFALSGLASGWPGGVLLRSDDSGNSWPAVGATNSMAKVFTTGGALGAHHGYSVDHGAVLTVTPRHSAHTLSSVTDDQLYGHANMAAYGADGRWEIVAFRTVTDNTGNYTLKDFLRGLYGSEWASGLHAEGDLLIMLDTTTVGFFGLPINALGSPRLYRAVTQGAAIDSADDVTDTYDAVNLKPLSPVDLNGHRDAISGDWTISATRRTRWPVEVFSGAAVPLGETSEAYEIELWDAGFATLKRTFSGLSSLVVNYPSAQQVADFTETQSTLRIKAYQLSSVVGRGLPLIGSITGADDADPFAASVVLLMHMESAALPDVKGHAVTLVGNAQYSTALKKFGAGSALFDGNGDYLSVYNNGDYNFGTGDFTVEAWIYIAANSSLNAISQRTALVFAVSNGSNDTFELSIAGDSGTTGTGLYIYTSAKGSVDSVAASISQGAWHHVAVCRSSGTVRFYLDGSKVGGDIAYTYQCGHSTNFPAIGGRSYSANYYNYLNGNIDEIRVTKAARYTGSTYTVPTGPFPNP